MKGVTDRQFEILRFVRSFQRENGYTPSVRDVGAALGMRSPSTVHSHLAALIRKGALERKVMVEEWANTGAMVVTDKGHKILDGEAVHVDAR